MPEDKMGTDPELKDIGAEKKPGSDMEVGLMDDGGTGVGPELEPPRPPRRGEQLELPLHGPFDDESHVAINHRRYG